jgi:ribosomal protein L3
VSRPPFSFSFLSRLTREGFQDSKKKAFTKYSKHTEEQRKAALDKLGKEATVIRVLAHTQYEKLKNLPQKKDYIMEIQVNGGSTTQAKVDFAKKLLEQQINVNSVFR